MAPRSDAHILIVDDDTRIRELLKRFLVQHGYWVSSARDAVHACNLLRGLEFDLIVMDVMMPGEDGITLTARLRETTDTPILLLTARSESNQRIMGLEAGADDYVAKPFEPKELLLRISAILRRVPVERTAEEQPTMLHFGDCRYDVQRGELWKGSDHVRLTATETALMRVFSAQTHETVTRAGLIEALGRTGGTTQERAVDVQITRLRRKLEGDPKSPRYLQTVRGSGYMLVPD